jgi:signal transduction histidine kinase
MTGHKGGVAALSTRPGGLGTTIGDSNYRLHQFIIDNTESIVSEWEAFARTLLPASRGMSPLALRDHIHQILAFFVADIQSPQSLDDEVSKSRGKSASRPGTTAAEDHAALRLSGGFDLGQMISEYRALRSSVIKLWRQTGPAMDDTDFLEMTRFNEAVDQTLAESASFYAKEALRSKDLLVGILSHDIRNPLQAIMLSAELSLKIGSPSDKQIMISGNIGECARRIDDLIDNLLDMTRARLGAGLQLNRSSMDMGIVGHQIVDEVRTAHPDHTITLDLSPNLSGSWDRARVGQVFANLLSNAVQYGFKGYPIHVTISGKDDAVEVIVHNSGQAISADEIGGIFDPISRAGSNVRDNRRSLNLGLGLYITQQILAAHGGTIAVTSSQEDGTEFVARFPRHASALPGVF